MTGATVYVGGRGNGRGLYGGEQMECSIVAASLRSVYAGGRTDSSEIDGEPCDCALAGGGPSYACRRYPYQSDTRRTRSMSIARVERVTQRDEDETGDDNSHRWMAWA